MRDIFKDKIFKGIPKEHRDIFIQKIGEIGSKEFREVSNIIDLKDIAEKEGITIPEARNRFLTTETKYKEAILRFKKLHGVEIDYISPKTRLQTEYYLKPGGPRDFHAKLIKAFVYPGMPASHFKVISADVQRGKYASITSNNW